jgi:osmotically-inducible protein OsmY
VINKIQREKNPLHASDKSAGVQYDRSLVSPAWGSRLGNEAGYNRTYGDYGSAARGWVDRPHEGKGPKGYQRLDESIRAEICETLTRDPDVDASAIEVEVKAGDVLLTGTVPERRMRYWTEEIVDGVFGVKDIENQIKVQELAERKEENKM